MHVLHEKFCSVLFNKIQDLHFSESSDKMRLQLLYQAMAAKTTSMSSFKASTLHTKFCTILCNRIRDKSIARILEKME